MKIWNSPSVFTIVIFLIVGCRGGQVNDSEILAHVENTENYEALELARMDDNLSTFVKLVEMSGLNLSLEFTDPFTLFLPTNKAFDNMDKVKYEQLTNPQNRTELTDFIRMHFLPKKVLSPEFNSLQVIQHPGEEEIPVYTDMDSQVIYIGGAQIIKPDIHTSNGIVHIINDIIQPNADIIPE